MALPAFAASRCAAVDVHRKGRCAAVHPPGPQQQTRRTPQLRRSIDGTDRLTDTVPLHRPCRILRKQFTVINQLIIFSNNNHNNRVNAVVVLLA